MDFHVSERKPSTTTELLSLLRSTDGASSLMSVVVVAVVVVMVLGEWGHGVHQPAVCPSLSAIRWDGDELEVSDGLPVRARQLWVVGGLPQGSARWQPPPHRPHGRCRGHEPPC